MKVKVLVKGFLGSGEGCLGCMRVWMLKLISWVLTKVFFCKGFPVKDFLGVKGMGVKSAGKGFLGCSRVKGFFFGCWYGFLSAIKCSLEIKFLGW